MSPTAYCTLANHCPRGVPPVEISARVCSLSAYGSTRKSRNLSSSRCSFSRLDFSALMLVATLASSVSTATVRTVERPATWLVSSLAKLAVGVYGGARDMAWSFCCDIQRFCFNPCDTVFAGKRMEFTDWQIAKFVIVVAAAFVWGYING